MKAAVQSIYEPVVTEMAVSNALLDTVLVPYKNHCRYLKSATVEKNPNNGSVVGACGRFAIDDSCYIADTGHFNAVEFNICYNQLAYCLLAQSIDEGLIDALGDWNLPEFIERQLSDFLIVKFSSTFRRPLSARGFEGRVDINKVTVRKDSIFMKTTSSFEDYQGGTSDGEALIVVIGNGERQDRTQ